MSKLLDADGFKNTPGGPTRNITFPYDSECRTNNVFSGVVVGQYRKITAPIFFGLGIIIFVFLIYAVMHYMAGTTAKEISGPSQPEISEPIEQDLREITPSMVIDTFIRPVNTNNANSLKAYIASSIGMVVFASIMASVYLILLASIIHSKLTFEHVGGED